MMIKKLLIILFFLFSLLIIIYYKNFFDNIYIYNNLVSHRPLNTHFIVIIFGTRPEAVKMIPIIKELKNNKKFFCITINTGQHKKMINQILESLNMSGYIDIVLNVMKNNQTLSELTSRTISELTKIFSLIHPDAVIVQGDTTTSFAAALSSFYQKIPVFHVEAGLRTNDLYSPFPEELNRIAIDDISTLFFASTELAAFNLIKENKNHHNIFVTGNTVVDTLKITLKNTSPSNYLKWLFKESNSRCKYKNNCKIILLTCHRRENFFTPISNILKAVQRLLKEINDIVIILPFHLNPNVKESIKIGLPEVVYNDIINNKVIKNNNYIYLNRLLLIKPLNYIDLVHLQSSCFLIMTDSGGIQEEGVSIGKPILILREKTERPEAVISGSAIIVGTNPEKIYYFASLLLKNETLYSQMAQPHNVYGYGNSSKIIVNFIELFFDNKFLDSNCNISNILNNYNYSQIISNFDYSVSNSLNYFQFDLIVVLTVWKRNNLNKQLMQIKRQSILKTKKTNIIVFQNSNHVNIDDIISKWQKTDMFNNFIKITFIKSPIETGCFGRFLSPLTSPVTSNSYFIICDDDIIWGDRYFENMLRVVDEGYLATSNGRLINENYEEFFPPPVFNMNIQVCFNDDIEYDFGVHIWAGRISWLRKAWTHIPVSIENSEDFWLSATLKSFYNISTRTPKCPCPNEGIINPDLCAASDMSAMNHENGKIGNSFVNHTIRTNLMKATSIKFNYKPLILSDPKIADKIKNKFKFGNTTHPFFNLTDNLWKDFLFWQ